MKTDELLVFRQLTGYPLLRDLAMCVEMAEDIVADDKFRAGMSGCVHDLIAFAAVHGFSGNLWQLYLTERLVNDENAFSLAAERREAPAGSLAEAALKDMEIIRTWYAADFAKMAGDTDCPQIAEIASFTTDDARSSIYSHTIRNEIARLSGVLSAASDAKEMLKALCDFYRSFGVGALGLHKAFRVGREEDGEVSILPIRNIRHVTLDDLVGYEDAKAMLVENTEAFLGHRASNNCLLYGDAGTGKSTSIMAITNTYFAEGLRVIELYKHQSALLHDVIDRIKNRNYRFIIYMDDLSFEDFETDYKYLKAVIEGGLEKKPENVLIYATSNRRHLVRESFKDKPALLDDDLHRGETVQEKLSLVHRFGVAIYFGAPAKKEYEEIVRTLAEKAGLNDIGEEELMKEAARWEMRHGGRSGRTATQMIDYLTGRRS